MPRSGKCKTDLLNFDTGPTIPYPTLPGFGQNVNIPGFDIPFPEGFPENIFDLLNKLKLKWPGGISLSGLLDSFMRKLSQLISNILTQISTFLAIYNLILAILEIIVCIIEVLCALMNPRAVKKKIKRLFRTCIPIFLSIFPFLALLALILAILALLLALIEYIIALIKKIIDELIKNFKRLQNFGRDGHKAGTIAVTRKIASILCVLENLIILFLLIKAVIDIIKNIKDRSINPPCQDGIDDCGCDTCPECADFLLHPENLITNDAEITYIAKLINPIVSLVNYSETVTLVAPNLPDKYKLKNMLGVTIGQNTNTFGTNVGCEVGPFFPPSPLPDDYAPERAPYLIDIKYSFTDGYGTRDIIIADTLIQNVISANSGTIYLSGGSAIDPGNFVNGWDIKDIMRGYQGDPNNPITAVSDAGISKYKPNYDGLFALGLTTVDCDPDIIQEKAVLYSSIDVNQLDSFDFPDIDATINGLDLALSTLRSKIDLNAIDKFNQDINDLMNDLQTQTESAYCDALNAMVSPLHSTTKLDPDMQFITDSIEVKVILRSSSLQTFFDVIGEYPMPASVESCIGNKITANVTLGNVNGFSHDGYGNYIGYISSNTAGDGYLTLYYDGQQFGEVVRPTDLNEQSEIIEVKYPYTFIGVGNVELGVGEGSPRRDETDIANS